mgnify:CR=1 FL=1
MRRILPVALLLLFLPQAAFSGISIRIFARTRPATVIFTADRGVYLLRDGVAGDIQLKTGEIVAVTRYEDRVVYRTMAGICGATDSLAFTPVSAGSLFSLRIPGNPEPGKTLNGALAVTSFPGSLQILNITTVEECLPGVVRAEAGKFGPSDYYRAQAVVARTFIYRNIDRHALDGYNMCDDTHCQVYPGVVTDTVIVNACLKTAGKVLTDGDSILVEAAFHGNCGGETASSADVWLAGYPYLVSVKDPWCSYSASSTWKKSISRGEWNNYLVSRGITPGTEGALYKVQPGEGRTASRSVQGKTIASEEIRLKFGLRSAYFTLAPAGDSIIVSGRGYGHGVGMCQDGAKHMAERKHTYPRILAFYYPGTIITDIKNARRPARP